MKKLTRVIGVVVFCLVAMMGMSNVSNAEEVQYTDNLIPVMTSNTSPSGVASASISGNATYAPFKAFNHTCTDGNDTWTTPYEYTSGWLEYDFSVAKCITKYTVTSRDAVGYETTAPKDWTFEAWDDRSNTWIVLDTQSNIENWSAAEKREFTFLNTVSYDKYRINITSNCGRNYMAIAEFEMMETLGATKPTKKLKVVLEVDEQLQLSVDDDLDENANVTWTSSDSSVATVDSNGIVAALQPGNTVVTASSKEESYSESVNILVLEDATDYRLAVDLKVGKYCRLTVDDHENTATVTWTVMDSTVATVSSKGKVKAVSEGLTIVTATDADENEIGQIYVRVRE
ncbi:MAG: Ig-like domain-containing protein [Velocimicrobium sp.]